MSSISEKTSSPDMPTGKVDKLNMIHTMIHFVTFGTTPLNSLSLPQWQAISHTRVLKDLVV
ncbi:hypothetical protein C475_18828 [Halosimplex carlsbadense 2-9-1]|uniref:Uncharacterized protein n=1 Tax=Halosimplex carlsbadense 2-9-1 TaxID=797114 RepID=M0CFC1_9EURY|nr:hypothetical protein C475_18828 [Halosimplex carlsbadense 2-9-1]